MLPKFVVDEVQAIVDAGFTGKFDILRELLCSEVAEEVKAWVDSEDNGQLLFELVEHIVTFDAPFVDAV